MMIGVSYRKTGKTIMNKKQTGRIEAKNVKTTSNMLRKKNIKRYVAICSLGVILISAGVALPIVIQNLINDGLSEQIVVPSSTDPNYDHWTSNNYEGAPEEYYTYYLWNLTNPEQYLSGENPLYEEIGPFKFRAFKYKYDITFQADDKIVTYKEYVDYVQVEGENASEINITNINPGVLGAFEVAGGTEMDFMKMNFPFLLSEVRNIFLDEIETTMGEILTREGLTDMLVGAIDDILEVARQEYKIIDWGLDFLERVGINIVQIVEDVLNFLFDSGLLPAQNLIDFMSDAMPSPTSVLYEQWANDNFPEIDCDLAVLYDGLAALDEDNYDDETNNDNSILLDLMKWLLEDTSFGDEIKELLEGLMNDLIQDLGDDLVKEVGDPIPPHEGVDIDGRFGYIDYEGASGSDLNIAEKENGGSGLTYEQCEALWNETDPYSLLGFYYLENQIWYDAIEEQNIDSRNFLMDRYSIDETQLNFILNWIHTAINIWGPNAVEYNLNEEYNCGVITTRTAEEWLFSAKDTAIETFMAYFGQDTKIAEVNIFDDCENENEAEIEEVKSYTIKTGQDNMNEAKQIVKYDDSETVDIWSSPEQIKGSDGMQFHQNLKKGETLQTFQPDLMRVVNLEYIGQSSIYGINLHRYTLSDDTFTENEKYFMDTPGFINLSPVEKYQGVPVRVSKPHFLDCECSKLIETVEGMNPDKTKHNTIIDVEPISGITMNAKQRIQINFEVSPSEHLKSNINQSIMPIMWFERGGQVPKDLANEFSSQVYPALIAKNNIMFWGLQIGAMMTITGGAFTGRNVVQNRTIKNKIAPKSKSEMKKNIAKINDKLGYTLQKNKLKHKKISKTEK
ncbi:MAG: hypothetical protein GF311_01275 [Candidatus Lokiarchaeota archaeon]|nr:hypothetical protein [Candidatus Lokiarchaeota archaeon]